MHMVNGKNICSLKECSNDVFQSSLLNVDRISVTLNDNTSVGWESFKSIFSTSC